MYKMPSSTKEILKAVSLVTENKKVLSTLAKSARAGCIAGSATIAGRLLLGPAGLAIGGAIGGCAAALVHRKMKSVHQVIEQDLTNEQRQALAALISNVLKQLNIQNVTMLIPFLLTHPFEKEAIVRATIKFLKSELNLEMAK